MAVLDHSRELSGPFKYLPGEILNQVISELPNADIKNLRQTCTYLKDIAHPLISRLFLSANLSDIQVFRAAIDHEIYRHDVTEIIYDDARLGHADDMDGGSMSDFEDDIGDVTGVPEWYLDVYRENLWYIHSYYNRRYVHAKETLQNSPSPAEAFKHIYRLSQEQQEMIATNKDADAIEYGLLRLPNLRRVTITPATHGVPGRPLYPTPTIRSLHGLVYPSD
ncbi:hypothetical protein FSST1_011125 [Fusarium sambucinum]